MPFAEQPCAPIDLKYGSSLHKVSSFTFTLKRVAQFVTSTILSYPPRPSNISSTKANLSFVAATFPDLFAFCFSL